MLNDFFVIFYWWVLIFGLGMICLPLTFFFFKKFFDQGYTLSKIIGILLVSYFVWLTGSLRILPFFNETIWLVILSLAAANFWLAKKQKLDFKKLIKKNWRLWILEESLFLIVLVFWSFVRGFQPNIHGLEKFMDFGFVNSIIRSRYFPPADMWLAGETINYYYFGHLVSAVLTKLSGLNSIITYNLMIATLCGLCFSAAFCLGGNLVKKKRILVGIFTALLLTFGGNLHPLYSWVTQRGFGSYWYPDATRFIVEKFGATDNTIHEFPIYSFVVADLHGHLLNLPFVLLFLALMIKAFFDKKTSWLWNGFAALLLAVFYTTNTWDFAIYGLVFGLVLLLKTKDIKKTLSFGLATLFGALVLSLPFHLHFKNISEGIGLVDFRSPPWMFLVLWGWPLFLTLKLIFSRKKAKINYLVIIFLSVAWFLIALPELIYVKDIYIHSHQRANTMFKLTYQSFVMFYLSAGYLIFRFLDSLKSKTSKFLWSGLILVFLISVFIYPIFAIRSYYGLKNYQGLNNGLTYLEKLYPDDYQAILWLRKNISSQPIIVEAVGESYTDYARVSANTGLPTILGWRVHEWLWRGSFDESGKRTEEVKQIYESTDLNVIKQLLSKYQAQYIFLGQLEREQYPQLQESKIKNLGDLIFVSNQTEIYRINY